MPELSQYVSDVPLVLALVAPLVTLDAVLPLVPSETLLVAGGVLVSGGDIPMLGLVAAGAIGAWAGHLVLYSIGAYAGPRLRMRFTQSGADRKLPRIVNQLGKRTWVLIVADFIPWGRTVIMFTAGVSRLRWRRFAGFAAAGAVTWSLFFVGLGVVGGSLFESTLHSLAAALTFVVLASVTAEVLTRREAADDQVSGPADSPQWVADPCS